MSETIDAAAARWFAAQQAEDMDWDGFTAWLEEDPRHAAAVDRLTAIDEAVDTHAAALRAALPANDDAAGAFAPAVAVARPRRGWRLLGGTVATAAAAAALVVAIGLPHAPDDRIWQTGARPQHLALAGGIRVTIAPRSRLTAIHGDATRFALDGAAYFDVDHRDGRALAITAGPIEVRDVGTRFGVSASGDGIAQVAVAEGRLSVAGPAFAAPLALAAGQDLSLVGARVRLGKVAAGDVASWRRGTLVYADAPLPLVAADLSRYAGHGIRVAPAVADRRFSGALTVGDGSRLVEQVAAILDLRVVRDAGAVRLEPAR